MCECIGVSGIEVNTERDTKRENTGTHRARKQPQTKAGVCRAGGRGGEPYAGYRLSRRHNGPSLTPAANFALLAARVCLCRVPIKVEYAFVLRPASVDGG